MDTSAYSVVQSSSPPPPLPLPPQPTTTPTIPSLSSSPPSHTPPPSSSSSAHDWNESFQIEYENIATTKEEKQEKQRLLSHLVSQFMETATRVSKIIVKERNIADSLRTIKEWKAAGGIAGGIKYLHQNIVFKFATDGGGGVYGGEEEFAQKAAGNEIRAMTSVVTQADMTNLHIALSGIVHLYGYTVIATAKLPLISESGNANDNNNNNVGNYDEISSAPALSGYSEYSILGAAENDKTNPPPPPPPPSSISSSSSLVFGSANGGKTVVSRNFSVENLARRLGMRLGLAEHLVTGFDRSSLTTFLAGDVEGHVGSDGRIYLIDLGRLMPPTPVVTHVINSPLYLHFRPEFLRLWGGEPLCSDALTRWGVADPNFAAHNANISRAFDVLLSKNVTLAADDLIERMKESSSPNSSSPSSFSISGVLHQHGVNVRYLPAVIERLLEKKEENVVQIAVAELFARCAKVLLNRKWRDAVNSFQGDGDRSLDEICIDVARTVMTDLVKNDNNNGIWREIHSIRDRYFYSHSPATTSSILNERSLLLQKELGGGMRFFARYFLDRFFVLAGIELSGDGYKEQVIPDNFHLIPRSKTIHIPPPLEKDEARKMLESELKLREEALGTMSAGLCSTLLALAHLHLLHRSADGDATTSETLAVSYCQRALACCSSDAERRGHFLVAASTALELAEVYSHFGKHALADECFDTAISFLEREKEDETTFERKGEIFKTRAEREVAIGHWINAKQHFGLAVAEFEKCSSMSAKLSLAASLAECGNLDNLSWLHDDAERTINSAIEILEKLPDSPQRNRTLLSVWRSKISILCSKGRHDEGRVLADFAISEARQWVGDTSVILAQLYMAKSQTYPSENVNEPVSSSCFELVEEAVRIASENAGKVHPQTLTMISNLVTLLIASRQLDKAEALMNEVTENMFKLFGENSARCLSLYYNLSLVYSAQQKQDEADEMREKMMVLAEAFDDKVEMQFLMGGFVHAATSSMKRKNGDQALRLLDKCAEKTKICFGEHSRHHLIALRTKVGFLDLLGRTAESEEVSKHVARLTPFAIGISRQERIADLQVLAYRRLAQQKFDEAEESFNQLREMATETSDGTVDKACMSAALSGLMAIRFQQQKLNDAMDFQKQLATLLAS